VIRPLEQVYPTVYFDASLVKVREDLPIRACDLAIGLTVEGEREVLGLWWQEKEGAKFWLAVLNDLHQRGVNSGHSSIRLRIRGSSGSSIEPAGTRR
jgi:transposase-like protein